MVRALHCILVVTLALGIAGSALGQPPRNPPPVRPSAGGPAGASTAPPPGAGKYLVIPGLFPLSMTGVQREIGLTPDQKQQLKALSDRYMMTVQQLGKTFESLEDQEKQRQGKDFSDRASQAARDAEKKAATILTPQQIQAVKKIAFELSATGMLADPNAQKKIGLSPDQQQRLAQIFEQTSEQMQKLQRETAQQAMQVLDDDQAAALKQQMDAQRKQPQQ
jgi:hypothetical protein